MTVLIAILCFVAFFGLIFWAEIYFGKLKKKQILNGALTIATMLFLIVGRMFWPSASISAMDKIKLFGISLTWLIGVPVGIVSLVLYFWSFKELAYTGEDAEQDAKKRKGKQ